MTEVDRAALFRAIRVKRQQLEALLQQGVPERVRDGSYNLAVDFKSWCANSQRLLRVATRVSEESLSRLQEAVDYYAQFT